MIAPLVAEGTVGEVEEGISPSAEATPPMSEEASEQTLRIPSTMEGRSGVSKTSVWFVCVKLERRSVDDLLALILGRIPVNTLGERRLERVCAGALDYIWRKTLSSIS